MKCVASQDVDFFIIPGDVVYGQYASILPEYMQLYNNLIQYDGFYAISASTSLLATWNDQEFRQGWLQNFSNPQLQSEIDLALSAYDTTFPHLSGPGAVLNSQQPQGGSPQYSTLWRSISWGDQVEIFILDALMA